MGDDAERSAPATGDQGKVLGARVVQEGKLKLSASCLSYQLPRSGFVQRGLSSAAREACPL